MSSDRWLTQADVLKDLTKASGGKVRNVDSSFFMIGERPPPQVHFSNEDDEMNLLFGKTMDTHDIEYEVMKPDLKGITKLIRMVQDYDKIDDESDIVSTNHTRSPCELISISKLNPNVKEFVPKSIPTNLSVHETDETVNVRSTNGVYDKSTNVSHEVDIIDDVAKVNRTNSNIDNDVKEVVNLNTNITRIDTANLKPNEIKMIATELKNKIVNSNMSKANTFEMRRERNVAIANLQKLYSKPLAENKTMTVVHVEKPLKLITPEYYEKCHPTDLKENKSKEIDKIIITKPNHITSNCEDSSALAKCNSNPISPVIKSKSGTCLGKTISLDEVVQNKNITDIVKDQNYTGKTCSSDPEIRNINMNNENSINELNLSDPQIQDSIKKVNSWLYKSDNKSQAPPMYLNPVAFKRKETNCNSPNGSIIQKISKPSHGIIEEYKPSEYADELLKKYTERATNTEKRIQKLTWANLDAVLKEKDDKLRVKAANRSDNSSANAMNISDDSLTK